MQLARTEPRYSGSISLCAWDIAKAGSPAPLRVRDRDGILLGTAEIGQGPFQLERREEKARMNIDHIEREEIFCANFVFFAVNKSPNEDEWSTLRA